MGFEPARPYGRFAVVEAANGVSLDFATTNAAIVPQHYAFLVTEDEFFGRITERGIARSPYPDSLAALCKGT